MLPLVAWLFHLIWRCITLQIGEKELPQHVTDAITHNIHHSFLHLLPLDILYYLATHHIRSPADLLAFLAATRALRFSPIIHAPPPLRQTSRAFLQRLDRDAFARACDAEDRERQRQRQQAAPSSPPHAPLPPTRLVQCRRGDADARARARDPLLPCAGCETLHPASRFSAAQLARAGAARHCRGSDGVLRVCPHMAFTYAEMRDIRKRARMTPREERGGYTFMRKCWECPRFWRHRGPGAEMFGLACGPMLRDGYEHDFYVIRRLVAVDGLVVEGGDGGTRPFVVSARTSFTLDVALRVLKAAAEQEGIFVCNHIRLGEPQTFRTEYLGHRKGSSTISEHRCPVCFGWVILRKAFVPGVEVELEVDRTFEVKSSTDKRWLAQIEISEE
ncbi:hypothetical protein B0J12DRAFT_757688 [Macrophomina phaseolina]|uniref:F-box domain-containing protein n=1 Tax=Macrophomina phaseolina TaxID=35725 RepID=A0ABQ8G7W7_9PEZI|nr:hypothetical protein B0J12DRAFT_757688 [Macrophomina phaseolina]